ncbi:transcriptional regulator [Microbacterium sp. STN6]|uniref:transcriptional regulator n=1 Tax=Microbacterium sp. STN6 TaxID=2995588 RepID=UPI002260957B|nr:transcriptional regulator [Microbacterium sp. STN6]MCX7523260.1 transcriptional regulator [Microbacterium sp. STN6]
MSDRVLFQDVIPYDVPSSLAELRGPASGWMLLPHSIYWGPEPAMNLDAVDDRSMAYQAIVREGTAAQQAELLNAGLLLGLWPSLRLPARCRAAWESRFPELAV